MMSIAGRFTDRLTWVGVLSTNSTSQNGQQSSNVKMAMIPPERDRVLANIEIT